MAGEGVTDELAGVTIKEIFGHAEAIAELHACLTSDRGENFRLGLLQAMQVPLDKGAVEQLRVEANVNEYHRHLNMLIKFGLVNVQEIDGSTLYVRSELGESAVNAVRGFERKIGADVAHGIYSAALGTNSIRLFLRIYGDRREVDWERMQIRYTPAEIGRLSLFLPRTIEGISAIDKLNETDLLSYEDDNQIYMRPLKARAFYQYLEDLHKITISNLPRAFNRDGSCNRNGLALRPNG